MTATTARFGSVSSGTLRNEDLIPAFVSALEDIRERIASPGATTEPAAETAERVRIVSGLDDFLGEIESRMYADPDNPEAYFESEEAGWDLEELQTRLEEFAPPFGYFGTLEGDGADFGFWFARESFDEAVYEGSVLKVNAGDAWPDPLPDGTDYVAEVSDHGNVSLYATDGTEIWAIV